MQPLVTIHLLTYNGERFVQECLRSVSAQTYPTLEILVTDNNSTDRTRDIIEKFKVKSLKLKVFYQDRNLGFAAGHNFGIGQSRGEYILCLNQDVVLDEDFVKYAVEAMESDPKIGAVQGKTLKMSNVKCQMSNVIDTVGLQPLKSRRFVNGGQGELDEGQYDQFEEIFGADGAAPLYRKAALEDIRCQMSNVSGQMSDEYFDEDFFLYKEDIDLAWRLRLAGWKTVYQPKARAWHARTASNAISTAKARQALPVYAKHHSFKNQRFLLLKNDTPWYFVKHLPWALPYEIASWLWVIFFEPENWGAIIQVFRLLPRMQSKRKLILARRRVSFEDIYRWFL